MTITRVSSTSGRYVRALNKNAAPHTAPKNINDTQNQVRFVMGVG